MNYKYKDLAIKFSHEAIQKFYLEDKNIFQKNPKNNTDVFFNPVDIGDNTIPNGNAIMLINLIRIGMNNEAKKLAYSLNGYLNIYKNHMITSLRALDFFNNTEQGKNCNEQGCKIDAKKINWLIWLVCVILWNYGFPQASPFQDVLVAVILSILFIIIQLFQSRYLKKTDAGSKFD